eukprot:TRINITY_DN6914_c0_g1_i1.p1 TRINITY_DN6914_c0_g1~~TRINITY_DN6914_c0_g1_i1.p1  ORF type:complete len:206 (+),score=22.56 TRINITY_DN6914_c0_g1_i1:39-620(+)
MEKRVCRFFAMSGSCQYGDHCYYLHAAVDRSSPPLSPNSNQICRNWSMNGSCKFNTKCFFYRTHTKENLPNFKPPSQPSTLFSRHIPVRSSPPDNQKRYIHHEPAHHTFNVNDYEYEFINQVEEHYDSDYDQEFDDFAEGPVVHQDGSICAVDGCGGHLASHHNAAGVFMYFQCGVCYAIFTNHPSVGNLNRR